MHVQNVFRRGSAGQSGHLVRGLLFGALVVFSMPTYATAFTEVAKLLPPDGDGAAQDFFGVRVAISGGVAVIRHQAPRSGPLKAVTDPRK